MKKKIVMLGALMASLAVPFAYAEEAPAPDAATTAQKWVGIVDSGDFVQAYNKSAAFVKTATDAEHWVGAVIAKRNTLGEVVKRSEGSASEVSAPEGAPAGTYTEVQFTTDFEKKSGVVEKVTMVQTEAGWQSAGYSVV